MLFTEEQTNVFVRDVLTVGRRLTESGVEVHRAEDTMHRIATAYGFEVENSFAILSMVQLTVRTPDGIPYTCSAHVGPVSIDIGEIDRLNTLARYLCRELPPPDTIAEMISPPPPVRWRARRRLLLDLLGFLVTAGGFALFFGGTIPDAAVSALIGAVAFLMSRIPGLRRQNRILYTLVACIVSGFLAELAAITGLSPHPMAVMAGDVMLFIPTLAVVNSVRELTERDITTGLCRLAEALLVAAAIGGGFGMALFSVGGLTASAADATVPLWVALASAAAGALGFLLFSHADTRMFLPALLGAVLNWAVYLLFFSLTGQILLSAFLSSLCTGIWAEAMARAFRAPSVCFFLPSILPLLPGRSLFLCFVALFAGRSDAAFFRGRETLVCVIGIVLGIVVASVLFLFLMNLVTAPLRLLRRKK